MRKAVGFSGKRFLSRRSEAAAPIGARLCKLRVTAKPRTARELLDEVPKQSCGKETPLLVYS